MCQDILEEMKNECRAVKLLDSGEICYDENDIVRRVDGMVVVRKAVVEICYGDGDTREIQIEAGDHLVFKVGPKSKAECPYLVAQVAFIYHAATLPGHPSNMYVHACWYLHTIDTSMHGATPSRRHWLVVRKGACGMGKEESQPANPEELRFNGYKLTRLAGKCRVKRVKDGERTHADPYNGTLDDVTSHSHFLAPYMCSETSVRFENVPEKFWITKEETLTGNPDLRCGMCDLMDDKARVDILEMEPDNTHVKCLTFHGKIMRPGDCFTIRPDAVPKSIARIINLPYHTQWKNHAPLLVIGYINHIRFDGDKLLVNVNPLARVAAVNLLLGKPKTEPDYEDVNRVCWVGDDFDVELNVGSRDREDCNFHDPLPVYYVKATDTATQATLAHGVLDHECAYLSHTYNTQRRALEWPVRAVRERFMDPKADMEARMPRCEPTKTLELYAGAGVLANGLELSKAVECVHAIEFNESAHESYRSNHRGVSTSKDTVQVLKSLVHGTISPQEEALLRRSNGSAGGPPCQGFSEANWVQWTLRSRENREHVLVHTGISHALNMDVDVMENVGGILRKDHHYYTAGKIRSELFAGRQCTVETMFAGHYGSPQRRLRVIFMAAKLGMELPKAPPPKFSTRLTSGTLYGERYLGGPQPWPLKPSSDRSKFALYRPIVLEDAICDLTEIDALTCSMKDEPEGVEDVISGQSTTWYIRYLNRLDAADQSDRFIYDHVTRVLTPMEQDEVDSDEGGSGIRKGDRVVHLDMQSHVPCMMTKTRAIHPTQGRLLTIAEMKRLMSVCDWFLLCGTLENCIRQMGNGVPANTLAYAIGVGLRRALEETHRRGYYG